MGEFQPPNQPEPDALQQAPDAWTPPPLLTPEQRQAVRERRETEAAASAEATRTSMKTGEPIPVQRHATVLDPGEMTNDAKIKAMRRAGMSDDQISDHLRTEKSAPE